MSDQTVSEPLLPLTSGGSIPQLGFGVFKVDPEQTERIVGDAFAAGYRHIDTAAAYGNEDGVGRAIVASGLPREELFITTKLFRGQLGAESTRPAFEASLEKLGLDHVDLYLIHWPAPKLGRGFIESWAVMQELVAEGLVRTAGVSNFLPGHLDALLAEGLPMPAINQVELHPLFQQRVLQEYAAQHGMLLEAWGPLAQGKVDLAEMPVLAEAAAVHGKSPHQVVLRWHLQEGRVLIPKTVSPERLRANRDILDFELSPEQMAAIRGLDQELRLGAHPDERN